MKPLFLPFVDLLWSLPAGVFRRSATLDTVQLLWKVGPAPLSQIRSGLRRMLACFEVSIVTIFCYLCTSSTESGNPPGADLFRFWKGAFSLTPSNGVSLRAFLLHTKPWAFFFGTRSRGAYRDVSYPCLLLVRLFVTARRPCIVPAWWWFRVTLCCQGRFWTFGRHRPFEGLYRSLSHKRNVCRFG